MRSIVLRVHVCACYLPLISLFFFWLLRIARTVVVGGLLNADMAEDVHRQAREVGAVCSIVYPLPRKEVEQHGTRESFFLFLCT